MGFPGARASRASRRAGATAPTPDPAPEPPADWPAQATDSIIRLVDNVRDKTAGPAITAARVFVYGFVIVLLGIPLAVMVLIGSMRLFESILATWFTDPIWIVYLTFGFLFVFGGLFCWAKARKPVA